MTNKSLAALMLFLGLVAFGAQQSVAQTSPQELLVRADQLINDGESAEAWPILDELSRDYAGQEWDAEARMQKAYVLMLVRRDPVLGSQMLESICRDFPRTEVAFRAKRELLETWARTQPRFDSRSPQMAEYLSRIDALIVEIGGTPVGSSSNEVTPVDFLDVEMQRYHLGILYSLASSSLRSASISGQFSDQNPDREALARSVTLGLRAFERSPGTLKYDDLFSIYGTGAHILGLRAQAETTNSNEFIPPTITVIDPTPDSVVSSQTPEVTFTVESGTVLDQPVNPEIAFTIDGQPIDRPNVGYTVNLEDPAASFFKYTVRHTPLSRLAAGEHKVKVVASELGLNKNPAELEWSFTVAATPPPPSTTQTIPVSKDSILSAQNPHRNEGANSLLQLSHRPEESGKANNPVLAFDLANVNVANVRKATLVLNIQECELPKKWGPDGRQILVYPITQAWVEGNGQTLRTGQNEKTRGSGQGVTWFSPIDTNIANKAPNGSGQWMGARPFLGPLTAPAVRVVNQQTGTISFDVTRDIKAGYSQGWLMRKQNESTFGNVRFYSKDYGNANLAPRLILDFSESTVWYDDGSVRSLADRLGLGSYLAGATRAVTLQALPISNERPSLRDRLRQSPKAAYAAEHVIVIALIPYPLAEMAGRAAYRSWLRGAPALV